jgi:hypothetical protein
MKQAVSGGRAGVRSVEKPPLRRKSSSDHRVEKPPLARARGSERWRFSLLPMSRRTWRLAGARGSETGRGVTDGRARRGREALFETGRVPG